MKKILMSIAMLVLITNQIGFAMTEYTLVCTKEGQKAIKDIKVGDEVFSENPETGEKGLKKVLNTYINQTDILVHVFVGDIEIKTAPTQLIWVIGKGWVNSVELKPGDKLLLYSGATVEVTAVMEERLGNPIKVYDFEVADWQTYFISNKTILVHNMVATQ